MYNNAKKYVNIASGAIENTVSRCMSLRLSEDGNTQSFYGSSKQPSLPAPEWLVESWVPHDGLESDDPHWGGGDDHRGVKDWVPTMV